MPTATAIHTIIAFTRLLFSSGFSVKIVPVAIKGGRA